MGDAIIDPIPPLWLNGYFICGEPTHDFYYDPARDIIAMNRGGAWLASRDKSKTLPGLLKPGIGHD